MPLRDFAGRVASRIPVSLRRSLLQPALQSAAAFMIDTGSRILGQHDPDAPPARLHLLGSLNYKANGYEFLHHFVTLGKLAPHHRVLDIGCGIGGKAMALGRYLKEGQYEGIDVVPRSIEWCRDNISTRYPNFHFQVADLFNKAYNPTGTQHAAEYRFPFPDASFDFVFLTSVFTHLLRPDTANYLREIARMLRPGGRLLGTWFLLNPASRVLMGSMASTRQIRHPAGPGVFVQDEETPEIAVGYDEATVRQLHGESGLAIEEPIHWGAWCGRRDFSSYQDMVIATRTTTP